MADKYSGVRDNNPTALGDTLTAWVPSNTPLPSGVKAVCFNAAGTVDITNADDTTEAGVPFEKMTPLLVVPKKVTAMTGPTKCYLVR